MKTETANIACGVCGGKGGFRKIKKDFLDTNWLDCPHCDGYGFVEDKTTEEDVVEFVTFNKYYNNMMVELQSLADVKLITYENLGKDLYIKAVPYKRSSWVNLVKSLLKFAHYNNKVTILPKQAFHYTDDDQHQIYWELFVTTESLSDLDGVIDLINMYNETLE